MEVNDPKCNVNWLLKEKSGKIKLLTPIMGSL